MFEGIGIFSITSLNLEYPPSCLEFCPAAPNLCVVGTYFLEKDTGDRGEQKRKGSLVLLRAVEDEITVVQSYPTDFAILDLHFSPHGTESAVFVVATSTGSIAVYRLTVPSQNPATGEVSPVVTWLRTVQLFPRTTLVLSFAFHPTLKDVVGVTLSTGQVRVCRFIPNWKSGAFEVEGREEDVASILEHELEAWTLAFAPDGSGVFSGGDDAVLSFRALSGSAELSQSWSALRTACDETGIKWSDRRIHGAGVTAILPLDDRVTVTGSYDDHIRVVSTPVVGRREVLAEQNVGGGVWRLKLLEGRGGDGRKKAQENFTLLASCMHAGARIVEVRRKDDGSWEIEVLARFEEHKSMNYGSDVQPASREVAVTVVSTSFYDKLLCLWRWEA